MVIGALTQPDRAKGAHRELAPFRRAHFPAAVEQRQFVILETSSPSRRYCPEVGRSRHPRMCIKVDLPEPDGPVTDRNSARRTSSDTPRRARTSTSPTT